MIGEEAHIIAQSPGGPRADHVNDPDGYGNLILLCARDHKRVDDQVGFYSVEMLKTIKAAHEAWVRTHGEHVASYEYHSRATMPPSMTGGAVGAMGGIMDGTLICCVVIFFIAVVTFALIIHHGMVRMA